MAKKHEVKKVLITFPDAENLDNEVIMQHLELSLKQFGLFFQKAWKVTGWKKPCQECGEKFYPKTIHQKLCEECHDNKQLSGVCGSKNYKNIKRRQR